MALERNGTVVGVDSRVDRGSNVVSGRGSCTLRQVGVYVTGANSIVGKEVYGGLNKVASERNGTLVGVDSRGDRGRMEVSGCGACTVRQAGVYETGANSIGGQDLLGKLNKVTSERNCTVVGVDSRGDGGRMEVPGSSACTVTQAGEYDTGVNSIVGQDLFGGVNTFALERNGTVVGVDSRGDGGRMEVSEIGACTVRQVGVYETRVNSILGKDLFGGVNKFAF